MWWNNKTLEQQGVFQGFTDHHCHLLPGVDDGVQTSSESLSILKRYEQLGIHEVWLTPHIQEYMPNETDELKEVFTKLIGAYKGNIKLHLAAEYMLDPLFEKRLEQNDLLFHSETEKLLLIETSYFNPPLGMDRMLFNLKQKGITPLLAHPERYEYMDDEHYHRLRSMGIRFQMNLGSLLGYYGKTAQKKAVNMLNNHLYDLAGTDLHGTSLLEAFCKKKIFPLQERYLF